MSKQHDLLILVDWLQFTLKTTNVFEAFDILGIPETDFIAMENGLYGYPNCKASGHIWVLYGGKDNMGIHVQLSGQGCREYETIYSGDWIKLFERLMNANANVTRLDLAVDDICLNGRKPYWTVKQLARKAKKGEARTIWKEGIQEEKIRFEDGQSKGITLYCGSKSSLIQMVIYEKDHERKNANVELEDNVTAWNRCELRLKKERAMMAVDWITQGLSVGELTFGIIKNYINFVDRTNDSNKSRWPVSKFWAKFVQDGEKLKLTAKLPDITIERKMDWIYRQVVPSLAEIWVAMGAPEGYFQEMIKEGMERMKDYQWQRAREYQKQVIKEQEAMEELKKQLSYEKVRKAFMELKKNKRLSENEQSE